MAFPPNWQNPISVPPGQSQRNVDPLRLLPSRPDLSRVRLDIQRALLDAGIARHTAIEVTTDGVIWDGHHAVRAAADKGTKVTVRVVNQTIAPTAGSILDLLVG